MWITLLICFCEQSLSLVCVLFCYAGLQNEWASLTSDGICNFTVIKSKNLKPVYGSQTKPLILKAVKPLTTQIFFNGKSHKQVRLGDAFKMDLAWFRCWLSSPNCHDGSVASSFFSSSFFIPSAPPLSICPAFTICWGLPSTLPPHLFLLTFLCFVHSPPSLQQCPSWSGPVLCSPCAPHFRFCVTLWPHSLSLSISPPTPSCCTQDSQIFLFFSWLLPLQISFGRLITVASKTHTKSQHDCYCKANNSKQAVIAIRNRGACSEHNV